MKLKVLVFFIIVLSFSMVWINLKTKSSQVQNTTSNPEIHFHAGLVVFRDGIKQDFSDTKYMHVEPCGDDDHEEELSLEEEQYEKAHLHDNVGDVVHVHRNNVVWKDLFSNIRYTIDPVQNIEAYVNGELVENILERPISEYDSLVLIISQAEAVSMQKEELLNEAVTKEHIVEVENQGESC